MFSAYRSSAHLGAVAVGAHLVGVGAQIGEGEGAVGIGCDFGAVAARECHCGVGSVGAYGGLDIQDEHIDGYVGQLSEVGCAALCCEVGVASH